MKFTNPSNGIERKVLGRAHRLWCFLFGPIYYASKGMYGWMFISLFTLNGLYLGLPLFNRGIVQRWYEDHGWKVSEK